MCGVTDAELPTDLVEDDGTRPVEAPWLDDPAAWSIRQVSASTLRPGSYCFAPSRHAFVRVVACTQLRGQEPLVFVDLADGRTLSLAAADEVFVRVPPQQA